MAYYLRSKTMAGFNLDQKKDSKTSNFIAANREWVTNTHYILKREFWLKTVKAKANIMALIQHIPEKTVHVFMDGKLDPDNTRMPDCEQVLRGMTFWEDEPNALYKTGVIFNPEEKFYITLLQTPEGKSLWVDCNYIPLLKLPETILLEKSGTTLALYHKAEMVGVLSGVMLEDATKTKCIEKAIFESTNS